MIASITSEIALGGGLTLANVVVGLVLVLVVSTCCADSPSRQKAEASRRASE